MWQVQKLVKDSKTKITLMQKLRRDETLGVVATSGFISSVG